MLTVVQDKVFQYRLDYCFQSMLSIGVQNESYHVKS